jgi:hypothetical protein
MKENRIFFFYLLGIHKGASLNCFIFLVSVLAVKIFTILDSIRKISGKKYSFALHLVEIEIRIGRPWMPILIQIWILQNYGNSDRIRINNTDLSTLGFCLGR